MSTLIHTRVEMARRQENPTVICRLPSGWAVLGDSQFLPGYCLLLPDPVVEDLNALDAQARHVFLRDMGLIGDALLKVTDAYRINYEILGNTDPALHAHIFARYMSEPEKYRRHPAFSYPSEQRASVPFDQMRDEPLRQQLSSEIHRLLQAKT